MQAWKRASSPKRERTWLPSRRTSQSLVRSMLVRPLADEILFCVHSEEVAMDDLIEEEEVGEY